MSISVQLRPVTEADAEFLYRCYASTRDEELKVTNWSAADKEAFLRHQFHAQTVHYFKHYKTDRFCVILRNDVPAGRLYVDVWPREIRIVDITVSPEFRGQGIGSRLLNELIAESIREGKDLSIHVEKQNPAMAWYLRMGFQPIGEVGVYDLMSRPPHPAGPAVAGETESCP